MTPTDWDTESYCTVHGCPNPATHHLWTGLADGLPVTEMVCCHHADTNLPRAMHKPEKIGLAKLYCEDCGQEWPCNGWNRIKNINKEARRG